MSHFDYGNLFAITLPETILEVASLLVLVIDLGWLRKSAQSMRMAVACVLGALGCGASIAWLVAHPASTGRQSAR